ncbi:OLC1v1004758C1, partial [Oldenlandia corymbosa var. corymbosa]
FERAILLDDGFIKVEFCIAHLSGLWQARNSKLFEQKHLTPWKCAEAGVLIQHADCSFMHGLARQFLDIVDPNVAEALALREALFLSQKIGLSDAVNLGDSALIVLAANQESDGPLPCVLVVEDVIYLCKDLPVHHISWIPRSENIIAHSFPKFS